MSDPEPAAVPVTIIAGFLGAGKTTLLLDQLGQRGGRERCAVVVNDFGEARIDAGLLGEQASVIDIPGACICCTAPEGLVAAVGRLLEESRPDRVFIESTGLGRPADIVDTLERSGLPLDLLPVVVVVEPGRLAEMNPVMEAQVAAAEILVANRVDLCGPQDLSAFRDLAEARFPPIQSVHETSFGKIDAAALERQSLSRPALPHTHISTEAWQAASAAWKADRVFDMGQVKSLMAESGMERIKGVLRTDIGWYLVQRAGGELSVVPTPIRGGSRLDVIDSRPLDALHSWLEKLGAAQWVKPEAGSGDSLQLLDAEGARTLSRRALASLPGQVEDVSQKIPGRQGQAVALSSVLNQARSGEDSTFLVAAHDGLVTEAVRVADAGEALLVHSLEGKALPAEMGGPFRILIPPGEGKSACANVKKVARILIQD